MSAAAQPVIEQAPQLAETPQPEYPQQVANDRTEDPIYEYARTQLERWRLTKGARFEAARRHKKSGRAATISIVIFSTYVFSISVILLTFKINEEFTSVLKSLNLIMSFFVVAFSLLQNSKRHELRSEMFLKCAQTIDEISTRLNREMQLRMLTAKRVTAFDEEYLRKIANFPDNHSEIDFQIFRLIGKDGQKRKCAAPERGSFKLRHAYWKVRSYAYIWKNVFLALLFPWLMIGIYLLYRFRIASNFVEI
ncbi:MAG: SLOG-associating effector domain family 5 [Hyphomicrobiales bacterium]|jgi:hypothetical protein|nr:SLOG-associating effector domain family 5 [Hyphomicrobiales bacterium]